jgi:hypothetical protein
MWLLETDGSMMLSNPAKAVFGCVERSTFFNQKGSGALLKSMGIFHFNSLFL